MRLVLWMLQRLKAAEQKAKNCRQELSEMKRELNKALQDGNEHRQVSLVLKLEIFPCLQSPGKRPWSWKTLEKFWKTGYSGGILPWKVCDLKQQETVVFFFVESMILCFRTFTCGPVVDPLTLSYSRVDGADCTVWRRRFASRERLDSPSSCLYHVTPKMSAWFPL